MARPFGTLKYDNLEALESGIDKYFSDCEAKPVLDNEGNAITDKHGNLVCYPPEPPTLEGLALALNISIKTLWNYGQEGYGDGSNKDYLQAISRAREKCVAYASRRLYDKEGSNGAKFYLTNNAERMGGLKYAERQEVALDVAPITFVDDLGDED